MQTYWAQVTSSSLQGTEQYYNILDTKPDGTGLIEQILRVEHNIMSDIRADITSDSTVPCKRMGI
jgi:hypothetical protein